MDRIESLQYIADDIENLVHTFGRRADIEITYVRMTYEALGEFFPWDRERFGLISGEEYFLVWEMPLPDEPDARAALLYVVCVTADSLLTAAGELMNLVSRKF